MRLYDCFMYNNENLILELRLNTLDKLVHKFVIVESAFDHQGNKKKLKFNINKFKKFKKKIIYIKVTDLPTGKNPWLRENFQRNCIERGLEKSKDNDLIIVSDLDEIPNPQAIKSFNKSKRYAVFKQNHFFYKINLQSQKNPFWFGSRICVKKFLKSPQWLRELKFKKRSFWRLDKIRLNNILENGGWHFCNLKSPKQLLYKYQNLCETNDQFVFKEKIDQKHLDEQEIKNKIKNGLDIIGRKEIYKFKKLDNSFPKYLVKNKKRYSKWIV